MQAISAEISIGRPVTLNATDSDLRNVLAGLAKANDVNLVMSNSVVGRISINLANVPFLEAMQLIAKSGGFTAESYDKTVVIARPDELKNFLPKITKTIKLQYVSPVSIKEMVGGIYPEIQLVADQRTNLIIASGEGKSLQKLDELIKILDVPISVSTEQINLATKTFALKYAKASSIQNIIAGFMSPAGKIMIDDRTGTLIVTDLDTNITKIEELITQLDIQTEAEKQKAIEEEQKALVPSLLTQVFTLNHIEASTLEPVIKDLLSQNGKVQTFLRRKDIVVVETMQSGSAGSQGGGQSAGGMANFYKDKWSDTLIVTDTPDIVEKVASVISELDVKSILIRIEAKIVEVNVDKGSDLGISWTATHSPSGSTVDSVFPIPLSARSVDVNFSTLSTEYFENILLRLQALQSSGQAKLLSNPSIVSMDNELAQMLVADKIPILKTYESQFSSTTGFEFINIGVMLNVVPHITEDGSIIMDAMPIVDSIKQWTGVDNSQPVISSRVAHCRTRLKDGETVAIGGLMKEQEYNNSEHVPWLGRLPIVGKLFGYSSKSKAKTDLVIFITPKIIKEDS
ncbi:TPA: hypothetical protein ENS27_01015 [bacterium]|nr:hypothetical protein [bacterium]